MITLEAIDPASVDNPPAGKFTIFINVLTGHLTSKSNDGTLTVLSANPITI